jgi:uncharacterized Rossmann fold enzyme
MTWKTPCLWPGETVAILGGGPSLTPEQASRAKQFRRIATNNAFLLDPEADVLCWGDTYWYLDNHKTIELHKGPLKVTWRHSPGYGKLDVKTLVYQKIEKNGPAITTDPCVIMGSNTGHGAINLAVHLGAKRILLLGFDMHFKNGHNWHDLHKRHADQARYDLFILEMERAAEDLKRLGVEVVNCSPDSALTCFPKETL